jgi:hypothetical protein
MPTTSAAPKGLQVDQIQIDPPAAVPPQSVAIAPDVQKKLYAETDARFAAKTHVTRLLDPHNMVDRALVAIWGHIYQSVLAEYGSGKIHWTMDHLPVAKAIADANAHAAIATDKLAQAVAEPGKLAEHSGAAQVALDQSATASKRASAMLPVDPHLEKLLAHLDLGSALQWISTSGKATAADAVTALQAQNASERAAASQGSAAPAAKPEEASGERGRPMPWGAFLGVCGAFGAVVAISSASK